MLVFWGDKHKVYHLLFFEIQNLQIRHGSGQNEWEFSTSSFPLWQKNGRRAQLLEDQYFPACFSGMLSILSTWDRESSFALSLLVTEGMWHDCFRYFSPVLSAVFWQALRSEEGYSLTVFGGWLREIWSYNITKSNTFLKLYFSLNGNTYVRRRAQ